MTDHFQTLVLRLAAALNLQVDLEYFGADTCWAMVAHLEGLMGEGRKVDSLALGLLTEITIELNVRSADAATYRAALEGQVGTSCPFPVETIAALLAWGRGQLHDFDEKKQPVRLEGEDRPWVPHKNLDWD
ncbi:MAG: hypothetical protein U0228_38590 [Myxococcaceae bacterium]